MTVYRKAAVCAVSIVMATCGSASASSTTATGGAASAQRCQAVPRTHLYVGGSRATRHQAHVLNTMLAESTRHRATFRVQVAILSAAMQESGARELSYGHGTSVGPLQLISSWGPASLRRRSDYSARWFLPRAIRIDAPGTTAASIAVRVQAPADRRGYVRAINRRWKKSAISNVQTYREACR